MIFSFCEFGQRAATQIFLILSVFILIQTERTVYAQTTGDLENEPESKSVFSIESGDLKARIKGAPPLYRRRRTFIFEKQTDDLLTTPKDEELKEKIAQFIEDENRKSLRDAEKTIVEDAEKVDAPDTTDDQNKEKFHLKSAFAQSMFFLGIKHGFRMTQKKTTRELGGPFFRDWFRSVKGLQGWRDSDNVFTNYVAHPLQGSVMGRIFINNSDRAKKQQFGKSKEYWVSRLKAAVWTTAWNVQFELGPISEASLGNVGLRRKFGYSTMGYVDLVITPSVGTGVAIGEDAIDKYILKNWFERNSSRANVKIKLLRSFLTPTMTFSNLLRGKYPWKRDDRFN